MTAALPRGNTAARLPFWLVVPWRLSEAYRSSGAGNGGREFLLDVVWAQSCLYRCIRLQDDLFDGHTSDTRLVYVSDQFLMESERTFARHFARSSRFWEAFRAAVETTARAILEVDALQQALGCSPARLAREYGKVAAVLEVAAIAVCLAHRREADLARIHQVFDHVAIGDQILDDLEDVADDLRRGRFNYVAQRICGRRAAGRDASKAGAEIALALAVGDGADLVLADADRRYARAAAAAEELRLPEVAALAIAAGRSARELRTAFHHAQVARVLGPAMRPAVSSPAAPRRPSRGAARARSR